jgi:hypothetical protein
LRRLSSRSPSWSSSWVYYANAQRFQNEALALTKPAGLQTRWLDGAAIDDMDITAGAMLRSVARTLRERNVRLVFAEMSDYVRDESDRSGVTELVGKDAYFDTLGKAGERSFVVSQTDAEMPSLNGVKSETEAGRAVMPPPRHLSVSEGRGLGRSHRKTVPRQAHGAGRRRRTAPAQSPSWRSRPPPDCQTFSRCATDACWRRRSPFSVGPPRSWQWISLRCRERS